LKPSRRRKSESVASAEEAASVLRHELRNKFSSILNATAYIQRSLEKMQLLERDARIARFLALIAKELEGADHLLDQRARRARLRPTRKPRVREG
jgi:hypothetical protein